MNFRNILIALVALAGSVLLYSFLQPSEAPPTGAALANVNVPDLSPAAKDGEIRFNKSCASCHGVNAEGQDGVAPPLIHKIYEPNHHGDASFYSAAKNGVRGHHWRFGDMPPVEGITDQELEKIVFYVRELQRANGIQ